MVKIWKLSDHAVAVVVRDEAVVAAALAATGLEDRCLTHHEAQFHIPLAVLHKYARLLGLDRAAQRRLAQDRPGSDLVLSLTRMLPSAPEATGAAIA
jgi:hypothetical protein